MTDLKIKAREELEQTARACGATPYVNRQYPNRLTMAFGPEAWEAFCQALVEQRGPLIGNTVFLSREQLAGLFQPPAEGCGFCNNPLYAGTVCKNCGRLAEQPAQPQQEPMAFQCKGIPRKGCNYLAHCDHVCNKCGEIHHHRQVVANFQAAPQPAQQEPVAHVSSIESGSPLMCGLSEWERKGLFALYTSPPQRKPLKPEQIDAAVKAWFENDIVAGPDQFTKRMRAAIEAANDIKEQP